MKIVMKCLDLAVISLMIFAGTSVAEEWYEGMENSTQTPVYNVGQQITANHEMPLNRIAASLDIQSELARQGNAPLAVNTSPGAEDLAGAGGGEGDS